MVELRIFSSDVQKHIPVKRRKIYLQGIHQNYQKNYAKDWTSY